MVEVLPNTERPAHKELNELSPEQALNSRRYFAAARIREEERRKSILEKEEVKLEDFDLQAEAIYNPIFEPGSLDERRQYWDLKNVGYDDALNQWKNRFQTLVSQVTDETRTLAIRSILPKENTELREKNLADISEDDAMVLFRDYSDNKSDIDKFIRRAIEDATDLEILKIRLLHLKWIATGFFGKETAAKIETQLLLEAEAKYNTVGFREFFEHKPQPQPEAAQPQPGAPAEQEDELHAAPSDQEHVPPPAGTLPAQPEDDDVSPSSETAAADHDTIENTTPQDTSASSNTEGDNKPQDNPTNLPKDLTPQDASTSGSEGVGNKPEDNTTGSPETTISQLKVDRLISDEEAKGPDFDLIKEINRELYLQNSPTKSKITIGVSPKVLMDYMISSLTSDTNVEVGEINITPDDNININTVKISKMGGVVTLRNVSVNKDHDNPGRILVNAGKIDKNLMARTFARDVEGKISSASEVALDKLKTQITPANSSWQPKSLSILDGNIIVGFEKAQPALSSPS